MPEAAPAVKGGAVAAVITKQRRPANVVIVAQAAKMARTIWAVTAKEQDYQRGFKSVRPNASMQAA